LSKNTNEKLFINYFAKFLFLHQLQKRKFRFSIFRWHKSNNYPSCPREHLELSTNQLSSAGYKLFWISGDTIVGSENWFKQYSGQDSSNYIFTKNKQDGFHYYHQNVGTDDLVYKYPAVVGDNYVASYYIDSITVQNIDTNITVPAGQFSCYEYHINEMGFYIYLSYFSPGTGKIKTISYTNGTVSNVSELISYHLE